MWMKNVRPLSILSLRCRTPRGDVGHKRPRPPGSALLHPRAVCSNGFLHIDADRWKFALRYGKLPKRSPSPSSPPTHTHDFTQVWYHSYAIRLSNRVIPKIKKAEEFHRDCRRWVRSLKRESSLVFFPRNVTILMFSCTKQISNILFFQNGYIMHRLKGIWRSSLRD